ncbi:copper chaperone PCu(A)C [Chelativorans alearense]|uniref:copper chaperone PCu(A)C n=1 Tax=Chelativorans alearense TaxID=2681495 RepID=UPI0013D0FFB0|nr:copper chaperone PCu(A)C [Chelativorans alearense]
MKLPFWTILMAALTASAMPLRPAAAHDHGAHPASVAAPVKVRQAWSPRGVPGVDTRAVYFELVNGGTAPLVIIGAESPGFRRGVIHETTTASGLTRMTPVEQLTVPPGQSASFRPQELHLMLTGAGPEHQENKTLPVRLLFADGTSLSFEALVHEADGQHENHRHRAAMPKS